MLWFAVYAVWDKVMELLPLTRGNLNAADIVIEENIRADAVHTGPKSVSFGPFPFHSVARVLQSIAAKFTEEKVCRGNGVKGEAGGISSSGLYTLNAGNTASPPSVVMSDDDVAGPCNLTLIQGIVLLNHDSAPPSLTASFAAVGGDSVDISTVVRCCLDVIHLGSTHPLLEFSAYGKRATRHGPARQKTGKREVMTQAAGRREKIAALRDRWL